MLRVFGDGQHPPGGAESPSSRPGLPYIRLIPKVTAVAGESLQLKCPVAGYPIEQIKWERSKLDRSDPTNLTGSFSPNPNSPNVEPRLQFFIIFIY
uniref:Ig-like domain-containing protein n=1 Tax=Timema monikensis TaxID=170555 RepID=A0A7R9HLL9_9NEOP|nr:unnamed protein product [Timema monikensis]